MKKQLQFFIFPCLACVLLLLAGGCSTIAKIAFYNSERDPRKGEKTFWAVKGNMNALDFLLNKRHTSDMPAPLICVPFFLLDLPISLATDLLMLPLDLHWDATKDEREARKKAEQEAKNSDSNETPDPQ